MNCRHNYCISHAWYLCVAGIVLGFVAQVNPTLNADTIVSANTALKTGSPDDVSTQIKQESKLPSEESDQDAKVQPVEQAADPEPATLEKSQPTTQNTKSDPQLAERNQALKNQSILNNFLNDSSDKADISNQQNSYNPPSIWRSMGALCVVLGLIILCAMIFKRYSLGHVKSGKMAAVKIISRTMIAPKQSLCLVRLGPKLILIGLSPNHMTCLRTIDDPDDIARILGQVESHNPGSISSDFNNYLKDESDTYGYGEDGLQQQWDKMDNQSWQDQPSDRQPWNAARREISSLLNKVKGIAKLKSHF